MSLLVLALTWLNNSDEETKKSMIEQTVKRYVEGMTIDSAYLDVTDPSKT
jgi:hypothetical protein